MSENKNWIDEGIDISDFANRLSHSVFELIKEAKEAEEKQEEWRFYEICDNIEIEAKMLVEDGRITEEEWDRLCLKYYPVVES